jgi:hypothetical protein
MMGRHTEDEEKVGESVGVGAVSVTLALSLVVPLRARLLFSPSDPVSIAAASTTRAAGSCSRRMKRGPALHSPATMEVVRSQVSGLRECIFQLGQRFTSTIGDTIGQI